MGGQNTYCVVRNRKGGFKKRHVGKFKLTKRGRPKEMCFQMVY